eukprot:4084424-Amphidinium_carterae.2
MDRALHRGLCCVDDASTPARNKLGELLRCHAFASFDLHNEIVNLVLSSTKVDEGHHTMNRFDTKPQSADVGPSSKYSPL